MAFQKRQIPNDFSEHWAETLAALRRRYHATNDVIKRWRRETGHPEHSNRVGRKNPVLQYTLDNQLIGRFDSAADAARAFYGKSSTIGDACNGKAKTAFGFKWRYEDADIQGST